MIDEKAFEAAYRVMCVRMNGDEASVRREIMLCLKAYEAAKVADQPDELPVFKDDGLHLTETLCGQVARPPRRSEDKLEYCPTCGNGY